MDKEEVERLAWAIAMANAHPQAEEWAQRVADAWEAGPDSPTAHDATEE